jgi:hypothetical protein
LNSKLSLGEPTARLLPLRDTLYPYIAPFPPMT